MDKEKTASNIPNLLDSLRATRATRPAPRNRSKPIGRATSSTTVNTDTNSVNIAGPQHASQAVIRDNVVQGTDLDAAGSRLSAVHAGYLEDAFARTFWDGVREDDSSNGQGATVRRMPIINRGTYVRTSAIDSLVSTFISSHESAPIVQILSLGAGTDTRYFRLMQKRPDLRHRLRYHEVDFPATTRKKISAIKNTSALMDLVGKVDHEKRGVEKSAPQDGIDYNSDDTITDKMMQGSAADSHSQTATVFSDRSALSDRWAEKPQGDVHSSVHTTTANEASLYIGNYHIHALDLRELASGHDTTLNLYLDTTAPTLILSEMCLTYLPAELSTRVLRHITQTLLSMSSTPMEIILYEPLHPHDAFGRTMLENLAARNIDLPGLTAFPTLGAHGARLVGGTITRGEAAEEGCGFTNWDGWTVRQWWQKFVPQDEKDRLRGLELIDEEEEWDLLAGHYGIIRGWRGETHEKRVS